MFEVRVSNELLDLEVDQVDYRVFNNAFNQETTPSDFTYDFELLNTPKNRRLLNFPGSWQVDFTPFDMACSIVIFGATLPAKLMVKAAKRSMIRVSISSALGAFDVLSKKLVEIPLNFDGSFYTFTGGADPNTFKNSIYPEVEWCLPQIINAKFYNNTNPTFGASLNRFNPATGQYLLNSFNVSTSKAFNVNALVPMPYLLWVLERGFQKMGLRIAGDALNDEWMRRLFLYANYSVESIQGLSLVKAMASGPGSLTPINLSFTTLDFTDNLGTTFDVVSNKWVVPNSGNYRINLKFTIQKTSVAPGTNLRVEIVVLGVPSVYTIPITGAGVGWNDGTYDITGTVTLTSLDIGNDLVVRIADFPYSDAIVTDFLFVIERQNDEKVNEYGTFAGWTKGLPDITFGELLTACRKPPLCLDFEYDFQQGAVFISYKNKVVDRTDVQSNLELKDDGLEITREGKEAIVLRYKKPDDDEFLDLAIIDELQFQTVIMADGSWRSEDYGLEVPNATVIEADMFPIRQTRFSVNNFLNPARIEQQGHSVIFETEPADPGLRIGFYAGVVNGYPMALTQFNLPASHKLTYLRPYEGILSTTAGRFYTWFAKAKSLTWEGWLKPGAAAIWSVVKPFSVIGLRVIQSEINISFGTKGRIRISGKGYKA